MAAVRTGPFGLAGSSRQLPSSYFMVDNSFTASKKQTGAEYNKILMQIPYQWFSVVQTVSPNFLAGHARSPTICSQPSFPVLYPITPVNLPTYLYMYLYILTHVYPYPFLSLSTSMSIYLPISIAIATSNHIEGIILSSRWTHNVSRVWKDTDSCMYWFTSLFSAKHNCSDITHTFSIWAEKALGSIIFSQSHYFLLRNIEF